MGGSRNPKQPPSFPAALRMQHASEMRSFCTRRKGFEGISRPSTTPRVKFPPSYYFHHPNKPLPKAVSSSQQQKKTS